MTSFFFRWMRLIVIVAMASSLTALSLLVSGIFGCGNGGADGASTVTASASILIPDGAEKSFSDAPLSTNLKIVVTFSLAVNPDTVEALFALKRASVPVSNIITWNDGHTVMTVKPKDLLRYESTYTVSISAGTAGENLNIEAFEDTFQTMVKDDVNGDGYAELIVNARQWEAENKTGRTYLFYGSGLAGKRESISAAAADAIITGEGAGDQTIEWGTDDVNDDGYADVVCSSTLYGDNVGRVYLFYGGSGDAPISGPMGAAGADVVMTGAAEESWLNAAAFNDVNGDGHRDMILNSFGCVGGCIFIFFGPEFASAAAPDADAIISGSEGANYISVYDTGDINGDGIADIVAGATPSGDYSKIFVFYGKTDLSDMSTSDADVVLTGEEIDDWFASDEVEDIDGDGKDDIVAGSFRFDSERGRVYLFYGNGLESEGAGDADVILTGESADEQFGSYVHIGDVTGDGADDMVVGAYGCDSSTGCIYGFLGDNRFTSKGAGEADFKITGEQVNNFFSPATLGDMNGDGVQDIVGFSLFYPDNNIRGRLYVFLGGPSIPSEGAGDADAIITGENDGDWLGYNQILDADGDGIMDLVGGALAYDDNIGRAYLFFGGRGVSTVSAAQADIIITGENAGDRFTN